VKRQAPSRQVCNAVSSSKTANTGAIPQRPKHRRRFQSVVWAESTTSSHLAPFRAEEAQRTGQNWPVFCERFHCRLGRGQQGLNRFKRRFSEGG
jgi:hypothetical protein